MTICPLWSKSLFGLKLSAWRAAGAVDVALVWPDLISGLFLIDTGVVLGFLAPEPPSGKSYPDSYDHDGKSF